MSVFDPSLILDETTDQALERRDPLPIGEYLAMIGEPKTRDWSKEDKSGVALDIPLEIQVPADVAEKVGYTTLTVRDSAFLDLTPNGGMDYSKGKNGKIRMYRDALDLNKAGERFNLRMLQGRMVKVAVAHRLYNNNLQEDLKGVVKA